MADRENKSHYIWIILSISPLLSMRGWVKWPTVAVCVGLRVSTSYSLPGRRTSLLWLNRLSRDPISYHLHSLPLSPFARAASSEACTTVHRIPIAEPVSKLAMLDIFLSFRLLLFAFLGPAALSVDVHDSHAHRDTLRHPWALFPSHLIRPDQTAITLRALMPIFLPSLSLSAGQLGLQQPIDLRRSFAAPLTWIHFNWKLAFVSPMKLSKCCSVFSSHPR